MSADPNRDSHTSSLKSCQRQLTRMVAALIIASVTPMDCFASMVFIAGNRTHVVVAADSRRSISGRVDERACKIKSGPRSIFVATGSFPSELLDRVWVTGERLTHEPGTASDHLQIMIGMFSSVVILTPFHQEQRGAVAFVEMTPNGPLVSGAYIRIAGGRITAELKTGGDWRGPEFGGGYDILGGDAVVPQVNNDAITSSLSKRNALPDLMSLATRMIGLQALGDRSVGGTVDIAIIDRAGARWQRCKAECGQGCPR